MLYIEYATLLPLIGFNFLPPLIKGGFCFNTKTEVAMDLEKLEKLHELKEKGILSAEESEQEK